MLSYKKKVVMTFLGIFGSALLLFVAFSIKYSIAGIAQLQFTRVFDIDYMITIDESTPEEKYDELFQLDEISDYQKVRIISANVDKSN